jgi:hypothetical protein
MILILIVAITQELHRRLRHRILSDFKIRFKALILLSLIWWPKRESNLRHKDFQSSALPTELFGLDG